MMTEPDPHPSYSIVKPKPKKLELRCSDARAFTSAEHDAWLMSLGKEKAPNE